MLAPRSEGRIDEAQAAWGAGIVAIGAAYTAAGDYTAVAQNHLDTLYGYKDGFDELFKPTQRPRKSRSKSRSARPRRRRTVEVGRLVGRRA